MEVEYKKYIPPRLGLTTIEKTRLSLSRVIRRFARKDLDIELYKGIVYGLQTLLAYFKTENDLMLEKKLDELSKRLEENKD